MYPLFITAIKIGRFGMNRRNRVEEEEYGNWVCNIFIDMIIRQVQWMKLYARVFVQQKTEIGPLG